MPTVTRIFGFDAGHRILNHESKCKHLHGHRYTAHVTVQGPELDELGRVIDFGVLKELIGGWIDAKWDHNVLLHCRDPLVPYVQACSSGKEPFCMPDNPTAENMAKWLYKAAAGILVDLDKGLRCIRVRLYETPNCYADYPDEGGHNGEEPTTH